MSTSREDQVPRWRIEASASIDVPAGGPVLPRRSSLWILVRSGTIGLGCGSAQLELGPGDAAYLHRARLHRVTALTDARVDLADLRRDQVGASDRPLVVRGFGERQRGVVSLLSQCPVTTQLRISRPGVADAYGDLLGSAMLSESAVTDLPRPDAVVRTVAALLEDSPHRPWTLAELAAAAHVGTTALVDRFRRETGLAPMQYLRRVRIERAMDELHRGDRPVAAIARDAGYGSAEAFVRAFRALTGSTPGRWRQSARGRTRMEAYPMAASPANTAPRAMVAAGPR